jgi:V/A-type H+-transporting ATPase subunit E
MALEELLAGLKAEAAAETAQLEAETQAEADRIVEEARAEARALQQQAIRACEGQLRGEAEQRRANARLEAAAALREAREEEFQRFLGAVRAKVGDVRQRASYPAVLRALAQESLTALPAATTLRVDPRDERLARELLGEFGAGLDLAATLATAGGVELASGDGRTVRNTIEDRLRNAEPALRLLYGEMLADPAGTSPAAEARAAEVR